jgi:glycosyltransferase involved in cell wall biosynthesis
LSKVLPANSKAREILRISAGRGIHGLRRRWQEFKGVRENKNQDTHPAQGLTLPVMPEYYALPLASYPKVTIVSILYGKEKEVGFFLESIYGQLYPGALEVILVDDCSPDGSVEVVQKFTAAQAPGNQKIAVSIIRNEKNLGNCASRNRGIEAATGDVVIIVDADCMLSAGFIQRHAVAHALNDCEVVIGPFNIETNGTPALAALDHYNSNPEEAFQAASLQDPLNRESFLNCITRNFSIKHRFIEAPLFDEAFSYSADPSSGYGWEDVEMGYRLYTRGGRIKYLPWIFTLHVTHSSSVDAKTLPLRSLRNYRRLIQKHPDLALVARRWVLSTYTKICAWCDQFQHPVNEDRAYLDQALSRSHIVIKTSPRRLRILSYRWHCPHQYELYKLPHDFTLLTDLGTGFTSRWSYGERPLRDNVRLTSHRNVRLRDFDLAVLHFDENVLAYQNTNNVIGEEWGASFRWMRERLTIPMIAICHGTPQFVGQYDPGYAGSDLGQVIERERRRLVDYLGKTKVVVNSHQAKEEWQFNDSLAIWQGFDPTEFPPARYRKGILTLGKAMKERPYYRGYAQYKKVCEGLPEGLQPEGLSVAEPDARYSREGNDYARAKFRNYVDTIRQYSIYFNPTLRSPMPRSRGEAMMCGLVTVSTQNHDVEMFIKNGWNGFYSNNIDELREYLLFLLKNPECTREIGERSRRTALDVFNHDRYLDAWQQLLSEVAGE